MKNNNNLRRGWATLLVLAGAAFTLLLTSATNTAWAGKPPPPPPPPADSGTIYFYNDPRSSLQVWSMKSDGTAKASLPVVGADWAEPSRALHDGRRWFLTTLKIPGEFYATNLYGSPYPRWELFAVSDRGEWLQLTDDPAFEAWSFRWTVGPSGADRRITVVANRWVQTAEGNMMSVEPGLYALDVEPETWASAPPTPQSAQRIATIALPIVEDPLGVYANIEGYDWSPDGTHVVYAAGDQMADDRITRYGPGDGLHVVRASDGATAHLLAAPGAHSPRWSPVQANGRTQILFGLSGHIDRVNDDGTGWLTVIPAPTTKSNLQIGGGSARWSPSGTHFVYHQLTMDKRVYLQIKSSHVWRAAADGTGNADLTPEMTFCYVIGWVNP